MGVDSITRCKVDGGSGVVYNRASSTSKQTEMANTFISKERKVYLKFDLN